MEQQKDSFLVMGPLFLVLFIDGMGLSLLFPLLNAIIVDPASHFLASHPTQAMRDFMYGFIVSIFMLCWFFGAAILGDLSDSIGRKKALMICLLGSFVGYFLSAIGIIYHSVTVLVIGRIIAGFTAGSQPIAQAAIIDVSSQLHKTRNIAFILLAVSLGFVVGPILGALLSSPSLISWFNYSTPLYFASAISLFNAIALYFLFNETFTDTKPVNIKVTHAIKVFTSAFTHPKIRTLSSIFLVMLIGWSTYFSFISMFLLKRYHYTPIDVNMFLAVMAIGFSIGCGFLVDYCAHRFKLTSTVYVSYLLTSVAIGLTIFIDSAIVTTICGLFAGMGVAVGYSTNLSMFSSQVDEHEQGWVMGVTGAIMALCFGVSTLAVGAIANYSVNLPMIIAGVPMFISAVMMYRYRNTLNNGPVTSN